MTLVTITYGNQKKTLLNADCRVSVFLSYIRQKCKIHDETIDVDLADEYGNLQCLSSMAPNAFASRQLKGKCEYILVQIRQEGEKMIVEPLLNNWQPLPATRRESSTNPRKSKI